MYSLWGLSCVGLDSWRPAPAPAPAIAALPDQPAPAAIAAILTAAPAPCVQLWDAVQCGDHAGALEFHRKLLRFWNAIVGDNLPANVKFAMELQGRRGGFPRAPMPPSSEAQRAAIRAVLNECLGFSGVLG